MTNRDEGASLLPCPFCGGKALALGGRRNIHCGNEHCLMTNVWAKAETAELAAQCWNERAPTAEQADAVRANGRRVPLNLTYEQISALYLLLLRRERPEYGWMEAPLVAIEEGLKPAHNAIHDRGFNSLNRQFFGDDRFKFDESAVPTEIAPASSTGDQA